uniref:Uncharacterized protein n=1 Tax=Rhizophora mucronata TaxID=61149 RepID=A0A2P2NKH1_RHIMU
MQTNFSGLLNGVQFPNYSHQTAYEQREIDYLSMFSCIKEKFLPQNTPKVQGDYKMSRNLSPCQDLMFTSHNFENIIS